MLTVTPHARILVSYSHDDEAWKDRLLQHLSPLIRDRRIHPVDLAAIPPGENVRTSIEAAIEGATGWICLVSSSFLASKFIRENQLPSILRSHNASSGLLIPVLIRACAVEYAEWLEPMQRLPRDGKPIACGNSELEDERLADVAREIATLLASASPSRASARSHRPELIDVDIARLPHTGRDLFGREVELDRLDRALDHPGERVLSIVAWGGIGKTALVNHWLARLATDRYRGADLVFGWSFYSQGARDGAASADVFVDYLLRKLGDPDPNSGSGWDRGERLSKLITARRSILVLDGLEPLQGTIGADEGRVQDPAVQVLLRVLATSVWDGLCVVSTRVQLTDLETWEHTSAPRMQLDHLSESVGVNLLCNMGVKGSDKEMREAVNEYKGHSLALVLLGGYLAEVANGDIRRRSELGPLLDAERQGAHARHVLRAYDRRLGPVERAYLNVAGLFDRPADGDAVSAILAAPAIVDLTDAIVKSLKRDREHALSRLRRLHLLGEPSSEDLHALDAHPLVREYFGEVIRTQYPEAWRNAHGRLFEHLSRSGEQEPGNIQEMAPLYAAVVHGCKAGRAHDALTTVYIQRIQRGPLLFNSRNLGAFGGELLALAGFFDPPWDRLVPQLAESAQLYVLNATAYVLRAVGRLGEAIELLERARASDPLADNWMNAAIHTGNLAELHLTAGAVGRAIEYARQSVAHTNCGRHTFLHVVRRARLADALHQAGRLEEAGSMFQEAEAAQMEYDSEHPRLYSYLGYLYWDFLLSLDRAAEVEARAAEALAWDAPFGSLLDLGMDNLARGRAALCLGDLDTAETALFESVKRLREAGYADDLARGLLARADYHLARTNYLECETDLAEARTLAIRCGMRILEADACVGLARLAVSRGEAPDARRLCVRIMDIVGKCGYHRRLAEVAELEKKIGRIHGGPAS